MNHFKKEAGHTLACRNLNVNGIRGIFCQPQIHSTSTWRLCLMALIFLSGIPILANAQTQMNLSDFKHALTFMGNSGDTMSFSFDLGTVESPAKNVIGFQVDIEFPSLDSAPSAVWMDTQMSWLGSDLLGGNSFDQTTATLTSDWERSDQTGQTGNGRIATVFLVRPGGFDESERLALIVGGIVMVDDMDFKMMPVLNGSKGFTFGPNPASTAIEVRVGSPDGAMLVLSDLKGQIHWQRAASTSQIVQLGGLSKGVYVLQVRIQGGSVASKRLIIQ